jgi:hypothetical protein
MTDPNPNYAERIAEGWETQTSIEENRPPIEPGTLMPYVYASAYRNCSRCVALDLIRPDDRGDWSPETLERFARGKAIEDVIVSKLILAGRHQGFSVQHQQKRYEIKGRSGKVVIVGKTDGTITFDDEPDSPIPFDVKSGMAVLHCDDLLDIQNGRWTRHMPFQLGSYMLGEGVPRGLLILDKPSGPVFVPILLMDMLAEFEAFLQTAERAVDIRDATERGEDPALPAFSQDAEECLSCDHYKKSCHPPIAYGEGLSLIDDPAVLELARTRAENEEAGKAFSKADKALKKKLRGVELGSIAGEFDIIGKWGTSKKKTFPDACVACGSEIVPFVEENPKGRFTVKILPAGEAG